RHTRFKCDWSSDVCSSDLPEEGIALVRTFAPEMDRRRAAEIHRLASGYPFWIKTLAAEGPDISGSATAFSLQGLSVDAARLVGRSEEHTSELQSHLNLVCR